MESKNEGNAVDNTASVSAVADSGKIEEKVKTTTKTRKKSVEKAAKAVKAEKAVEVGSKTAGKKVTGENVTMNSADVKVAKVTEKKAKRTSDVSSPNAETKKVTKRKAEKVKECTESRTTLYVQYAGREFKQDDIIKKIQNKFVEESGKSVSAVKSLDIYVKPEEDTAYYVINKKNIGSVEL